MSDWSTRDVVMQATDIHHTFQEGPQSVSVLRGLSFTVRAGERVAVVGRSGAGKTTLLHILGGLERPSRGQVLLAGQAFSAASEATRSQLRNRHLGFVYQLHHLLMELTARENVALPQLLGGARPSEALQRADALLAQVGLGARVAHKPAELSGGERQRVALARALANRPALVLADEPTGNLDRETAESIHALIVSLNEQEGTSFVLVTHESPLAALAHRKLVLDNGLWRT